MNPELSSSTSSPQESCLSSRVAWRAKSIGRMFFPILVVALAFAACSSAAADGELAISSESAGLTQSELANLATALAVGENFDGEQIVVTNDLLRTLATIHIRSTAVVDLLRSQEEGSFTIEPLEQQAEEAITQMIESGQITELDSGSTEFAALRNIVLADQGSNQLRAERDPATGESVVGNNPFTSSFLFDPNLRANFNTVSPGFLDQFNDTFAEFTEGVTVAADLGLWNPETFVVDAP